ncbi:unnamed protein product [Mytilus edulis]|uniref:Integrase catalytic domain-containing protein n=1 Tax=Mytilus edulis TaxID=6550 RepID=A0A8S3SVS2_MYTED|nr:unnamed protein product [Mytilus edulis]
MCSFSPAVKHYWLNWSNLVRIGGVIYQKWREVKSELDHLQLLVAAVIKKEIIISCHDTAYSGHFGIKKSVQKMKNYFTWYQMTKDVRVHIENCVICTKSKSRKSKAGMVDYRVGYPLDRVSIDVIGPLPQTQRRNKYLLVIGDNFTRWMEVYPLPHQKADIVAQKFVMEFITRFGIPLELHSDQGSNFQSELFKAVCSILEITKTRTTPYHPASNGLIERFNRTLAGMIKSFINKNATDWDVNINLLLAAYRSTPHPATGFSPNFLMLGREISIPIKLIYPLPDHKYGGQSEYAQHLQDKLQDVYQIARKHLKTNAERLKKNHDTRLTKYKYKKGDLVYKFDKTIRQKFKSPWLDPYLISKVLSTVVYEICFKTRTEVVHIDKLIPYVGEIPDWVNRKLNHLE